MFRIGLIQWTIVVFLLLGCAVTAPAQGSDGKIQIEVKDPSGAAMQASGRLKSVPSGMDQAFRTDAKGAYTFANLSYGRYVLQVSRRGFASQSRPLEVLDAKPVLSTVKMQIGPSSEKIDVVAMTPLGGTDLELRQIPAPVQRVTSQDIENSGALDLSAALNQRLGGININESQGNPYQPDVNYRGYTASPLLGTPEGLSIYMDGVRQNMPFGDTVAWDLIPRIAIQEASLMPGSNPLFGLNTLGGAISLTTKDGNTRAGSSLEVNGGSFGRRAVAFEHGGANKRGWNWYVAGNLFHEDGWRVASPSNVRQVFGKVGWQNTRTQVSLSGGYADNELAGNGMQEMRFLARDYTSVYTLPDITNNRSPYFNLTVRHALSEKVTLSGNAYFRYMRTDTFNADLNNNSFDQAVYTLSAADQAALNKAGYKGFPTGTLSAANTPFPFWRCIAQALQLAGPADRCDASETHTFTKQHNYGFTQQVTWNSSPGGNRNQFAAGLLADFSSLTFQQYQQFGYLNPDHLTVTTVNAFADGSTNSSGVPVDTRVNLRGLPSTFGLFVTDTLSLGKKWTLTSSGRYNRTRIDNSDRLPAGSAGGRGSLSGQYVYGRFNPSAGVTFSPLAALNLYASYSEGSRAPTSIELGCADQNHPCNLPNALVSDPALKEVVTRTIEAGVRSGQEQKLNWSAGWFRAQNYDDLLFVSSPQTGFGYFRNFGKTRRQGLETSVSRRFKSLMLGANYTFVDATYQSHETIDGSNNSSNDAGKPGFDGNIQIFASNRIPLIPHHIGKAFANYQITSKFLVNLNFIAVSSSYARGNENNLSQPDGKFYLGPGSSPGYGVTNLGAHYQVHRRLQFFVQVNNLFNHHYYTAAQLGSTPFTNSGTIAIRALPAINGDYQVVHSTFYAPGAPIGAWGGMRLKF